MVSSFTDSSFPFVQMTMKNQLIAGTVALGTVAISSSIQIAPAQAATFAYNLNCVLSGQVNGQSFSGSNTCFGVSPVSFGTLTLSDKVVNNVNQVQLNLDLTGTANKVLSIALDFDNAKFSNSSPFSISSTPTTSIKVDEDKIKANGYKGDFDLDIPQTGNIGTTDTFSALISLTSGNLFAADLNQKDTLSNIFAAVHIGNYNNDTPGQPGGGSIWVGATPAAPIPTPALLPGLLGMGIAALRKRKQAEEAVQE